MKIFSKRNITEKIKTFWAENPTGVVSLCGPTASGKTSFSIDIAKTFDAEIISVDSRQIYKSIDIGSAKVTEEEMEGVPHHGIDIATPEEEYDVYQFQQYAFEKIKDIQARGKKVILCGGTMLWLDAITENYAFSETKGEKSTEKKDPLFKSLKIGMYWPREELYSRINLRVDIQFADELKTEVENLYKLYPNMTKTAETSTGVQEMKAYLDGMCTKAEAIEVNKKRDRNYAKRQLTWWRGREDIFWCDSSNTGITEGKL